VRQLIAEWVEVSVLIAGESTPLSSGCGKPGVVPSGAFASAREARDLTAHWRGCRTIRAVRRYLGSSGELDRFVVAQWWEVDGRPYYDRIDALDARDRAKRHGRRGRLVVVSRYADASS
jgi:hypothetical protein